MHYFDAHCDTVMRELEDPAFDFVAGRGRSHIDLPRLLQAGSCAQVFAIFTAQSHYPGEDMHARAERAAAIIKGWAASSGGRMRIAYTADHIRQACPDGIFHGILGLEGADCLNGRAEELDHFFALGVRNVIPAWDDNAFSGTAFGEQGPLTAEGIKLVELCAARHVMVDVSHLSDAAFWQVLDLTRGPFIASHSNCRALAASPRNLTDEMIRALAGRGGVMGINLSPDYLAGDYYAAWTAIAGPRPVVVKPQTDDTEEIRRRVELRARLAALPLPDVSWVARQAAHAIQVGGEDCVGLGGDLDGILSPPAGFTGIENYPWIADALEDAGLSATQVEKVCWRNMARVFADVLPAGPQPGGQHV